MRLGEKEQAALDTVLLALIPCLTPEVGVAMNTLCETLEAAPDPEEVTLLRAALNLACEAYAIEVPYPDGEWRDDGAIIWRDRFLTEAEASRRGHLE